MKMLNKKPRERITIAQIKAHPFFKDINWKKLAERKVVPPVFLRMEDTCDDLHDTVVEQFNACSDETNFLSNVPI